MVVEQFQYLLYVTIQSILYINILYSSFWFIVK